MGSEMMSHSLEETFYLTGFNIDVNPSEGRIRAGSWHQADGSLESKNQSFS
jgi:hypothetical protein